MNGRVLSVMASVLLTIAVVSESEALSLKEACKNLNSLDLSPIQKEVDKIPSKDEKLKQSIFHLLGNVLELYAKVYVNPPLLKSAPDNPYWITVDSGNAIVLSCDDSLVEETLYYPIGLMVKVLGTLELPNRGENREHSYVVTEYGLRMFIPTEHLKEILSDRVYFFRDGPGSHYYCKSKTTSCDPTTANSSGYPSLHPDYGYATRTLEPSVAQRVEIFRLLLPTPSPLDDSTQEPEALSVHLLDSLTQNAGKKMTIEDAVDLACSPFTVEHHKSGGQLGYAKAYFSLCRKPPKTQLPATVPPGTENDARPTLSLGGIKIVTLRSSKAIFDSGIDGSFQRFAYDFEDLERKLKRAFDLTMVVRKECGVTLKKENTFSLGGSISAGADLSVVSTNGDLQRMSLRSIKEEVDKSQFYLYSTYTMSPLRKLSLSEQEWNQQKAKHNIYDIQSIASCRSDQPMLAENIVIYHPTFQGDYLPLATKEDLIKAYTKRYSNYGFAPLSDPAFLSLGKFWRSRGSDQYYMWRDVLTSRLPHLPQIRGLLHTIDKSQHVQIIRFFAHLTMASAINFE